MFSYNLGLCQQLGLVHSIGIWLTVCPLWHCWSLLSPSTGPEWSWPLFKSNLKQSHLIPNNFGSKHVQLSYRKVKDYLHFFLNAKFFNWDWRNPHKYNIDNKMDLSLNKSDTTIMLTLKSIMLSFTFQLCESRFYKRRCLGPKFS